MSDKKVFLCQYCRKPIPMEQIARDENIYRLATGWVRKRAQGGANGLRLPTYHEEFAHRTCVDLTVSGIMKQDGLF